MQLPKWILGLAATEAVPALFVADTLLCRLWGWRFASRFDKLAVLFVAAIGLVCLLPVLSRRARRFYEERRAHLLLLICAVSSSVLAGELVSRVIRPEPEAAPFHGHLPLLHRVFHPDPACVPGVGAETHFSTNLRGIRGPEIPADRSKTRILCVGGSTTQCLYLDDSKTWTHRLMLDLNDASSGTKYWVGDMGYSGYSSTMHLRFVESSEMMRLVDYLLILVGFNDLNKALIRRATREEIFDREARAPVWCHSRLLELTRLRPDVEGWRIITAQQDTGGTFMTAMRRDRQTRRLRDDSPDLDIALEEYAARLRSIVTVCKAQHVRLILMTQPVLWSDRLSPRAASLLWHGWTDDGRFWPVPTLRKAMDRFNAALIKVCQDTGTDYVDLVSMSGDEAFFYDDCHFTEAGASEVARLITASGLLERRAVP
jgi:lysophospholipase L1-like esterase